MEVKAWPDEASAQLSVHELPQVWAPIPAEGGVLVTDAGRFARIVDGEAFRYLAYLEYLPGQTRGNHYHHVKEELLYITHGRLLAYYVDIDTGRNLELTLGAGHVIRTGPRLAHAYHALTLSYAIEIAVQPFDPTDTVPYEVYPISNDPRTELISVRASAQDSAVQAGAVQDDAERSRELELRERVDPDHPRHRFTTDRGRFGARVRR